MALCRGGSRVAAGRSAVELHARVRRVGRLPQRIKVLLLGTLDIARSPGRARRHRLPRNHPTMVSEVWGGVRTKALCPLLPCLVRGDLRLNDLDIVRRFGPNLARQTLR